jgi:hypothetical protein
MDFNDLISIQFIKSKTLIKTKYQIILFIVILMISL